MFHLEDKSSAAAKREMKLKLMVGIVGLVLCATVVVIASGKPLESANTLKHSQLDAEKSPIGDIVGGVPVTPNEFPFVVSLQRTDLANTHSCGGSIVGAMDVLTAAHCCSGKRPDQYRVVAGEHSTTAVSGLEQIRSVESLTVHPQYGVGHQWNADVCVVRLKEPLLFNTVVQAAILPAQGAAAPPVGTAVTVIGWGRTSSGGVSSPTLLKTTVNVGSDATCARIYNENMPANMICASSAGRDACQGDSGGPLFTADRTVVGVVSWGRGCAHPNWPGVYAEVSFFRNWIDENSLAFSIVESNGRRCSSSCPAGTAVLTGKYWSNSDMYMCAVNSNNQGYRGGYNAIIPQHGLDVKCTYTAQGGVHKSSTYGCVCSPNYRLVDANSQTCPDACRAHNLNAVPTGIYNGVATQVMYACAANWSGAGYRGGRNSMVGSYSRQCAVAGGNKENYENPFRCVCV